MTKINENRRDFLKSSSLTAAGIGFGASSFFPASIAKALAIPANNVNGDINDIEHIVVLMQENRSFNHYFGTMQGVRGFGDRHPIPTENGTVWQQRYKKGQEDRLITPYHLDSQSGNAQRVNGTPHTYPDAQYAWDLGRMTDWATHKELHSMGYFTEQELQFQFALANAFTICDGYYCSFHGGTNPNRLFHWSGINHSATDPNSPALFNDYDSLGSSDIGYTWTTYPERLEEAGVTWKVYQNLPDNFTDNPLAGFRTYRRSNEIRGNEESGAPYPEWNITDNDANPLLKAISNTMNDEGFLQAFKDDIANGTLPQVSWIIAPADYSEHPGPSSPVQGGWYTQALLEALTDNPEVWSKTALIINFDENDGFFDHMPPPCAPSIKENGEIQGQSNIDMTGEYHDRAHTDVPENYRPYGPGPRVPCYVISPWSRGGWVNSQVFDHTSVLQFIEKRFGVIEENITPYRRAICGDLTSAFNFQNPNDEPLPKLPKITKKEAIKIREAQEQLDQITPPSEESQLTPNQEIGLRRPSRALPYELHVNSYVDPVTQTIKISMNNNGSQAAVLHVYDLLNLEDTDGPKRYAINVDEVMDDSWDLTNVNATQLDSIESDYIYHLWVLGPNGFHREFKGSYAESYNPEVNICYNVSSDTPAIVINILNPSEHSLTFSLDLSVYQEGLIKRFTLEPNQNKQYIQDVSSYANWYDFTITADDLDFKRRYSGRLENGQHTFSDPMLATGK